MEFTDQNSPLAISQKSSVLRFGEYFFHFVGNSVY